MACSNAYCCTRRHYSHKSSPHSPRRFRLLTLGARPFILDRLSEETLPVHPGVPSGCATAICETPLRIIFVYVAHHKTATTQASILAELAVTKVTDVFLRIEWYTPTVLDILGWEEEDGDSASIPGTDPVMLAFQRLDPAVCAQQIMEQIDGVQTIGLKWDLGPQGSREFIGVVEENQGIYSLRALNKEVAAKRWLEVEYSSSF